MKPSKYWHYYKYEIANKFGVHRNTIARRAKRASKNEDCPFSYRKWKLARFIPENWVFYLLAHP